MESFTDHELAVAYMFLASSMHAYQTMHVHAQTLALATRGASRAHHVALACTAALTASQRCCMMSCMMSCTDRLCCLAQPLLQLLAMGTCMLEDPAGVHACMHHQGRSHKHRQMQTANQEMNTDSSVWISPAVLCLILKAWPMPQLQHVFRVSDSE